MLKLLQRNEIDDERWNHLIENSITPLPYAYSWYLDVMSPGWKALVYKDYELVMPLTIGNKFGVDYLYQPYYTQQLGVFSASEIKNGLVESFLSEIKNSFSFIQIHLHYRHQVISQNDFQFLPRLTHHLHLNKSYDEINKNYHYSLRKNVRQAAKKNLTVTTGDSAQWLIDAFKTVKGKDVNELKPDDYQRLEKLIDTAVAKGCGNIFSVYDGDKKIASAFMLQNKSYVIPLFSMANHEGRMLNAISLLFDSIIQKLSGSEMIFDFEGSQIESINTFNRGFGAEPVTHWMLYRNALPWHIRIIKRLKDGL